MSTSKSPYYGDENLRLKEIKVLNSQSIPRNPEEAYSWFLTKLTNSSKESLPDRVRILEELAFEIATQRLQNIDLSGSPLYAQEAFNIWSKQRQDTYNALVSADWAVINRRFEETGLFCIDLGNGCLVYPVAINPDTLLEDKRYATRPLPQVGMCQSYNIQEDMEAKKATEEMKIGQNEHFHINVGTIKTFQWNGDFYGNVPEVLHGSFAVEIQRRLQNFKELHGSLTPKMLVKKSDVQYHALTDLLLCGYRIELSQEKR